MSRYQIDPRPELERFERRGTFWAGEGIGKHHALKQDIRRKYHVNEKQKS